MRHPNSIQRRGRRETRSVSAESTLDARKPDEDDRLPRRQRWRKRTNTRLLSSGSCSVTSKRNGSRLIGYERDLSSKRIFARLCDIMSVVVVIHSK
ncbi:unnamed protein product [Dibothriocephalus latus]|uniref:Uncharacterized protein n=1 Tax=Dibothriocephalus latus TaxID=60516 RepID=A0A3P6PYB8_DIBLA|nr:unnamed protein product [Dibothriocephalus latus]